MATRYSKGKIQEIDGGNVVMLSVKLNKDLYQKTKKYITDNGQDIDGTEEYVIDEIINGSRYDFTVAFDDVENAIEVIEGFILEEYKYKHYRRGNELFKREAEYIFDKILENIQNNA